MRLKEKQKITKEMDVTIGYKCDNCGKEVKSKDRDHPDDWHLLGHNSGYPEGYDSDEVCSPKCYIEKVKYLSEMYKNDLNASIDDMTPKFALLLVEYTSQSKEWEEKTREKIKKEVQKHWKRH